MLKVVQKVIQRLVPSGVTSSQCLCMLVPRCIHAMLVHEDAATPCVEAKRFK